MVPKVGRNGKRSVIPLRGHVVALAAAATFVLAPAAGLAGGAGPSGPSGAVRFEEIPGSQLKRVILSARAAERLGIETGEVFETVIVRTQLVGGRIVPRPQGEGEAAPTLGSDGFGGFAAAAQLVAEAPVLAVATQPVLPELGRAQVAVALSPDEWSRTQPDAPARIVRLQTREGEVLMAQPSGLPPIEDPKRTMLTVYYDIPGENHGFALHERVRVELQLADTGRTRKVVPYAAVYYDGHGKAWVYANPEPLVYVRMPIEIERIEGDLAVLNDGPPLGTRVVTTGAPLLYGAEVIYKR
jgi:hypothetical protein